MIKLLSSICLFFLFISVSFADSLPSFPMTVYGTITGAGIGTKISFYDGNNSLLTTYATTREGWYGYDSTIAGTSPIFSGFTGALRMSIEYQNKAYTLSSITGSIIGCPASDNIIFTSNVCRYDIVAVSPVIINTSSGGGGGGGGGGGSPSYSSPIVTTPTVTINTGTTQSATIPTLTKDNTTKTVNETTSKDHITTITSQELKKTKIITLVTVFKKGTKLAIFRVLPNGRKIQTGSTRVLPNGKIRFTMKTSGKYIFIQD